MFFIILILLLSIFSFIFDRYIYLRTISSSAKVGRVVRISYVLFAVVTGISIVFAYLLYWVASDRSSEALKAVMWVISLFFVIFIPKMVYVIVSLGDYPVQFFRRKRGNNKRCLLFSYIGTALALMALGMMIHSITYGRTKLRVERVEIISDELPDEFDGIKVALFSDAHIGTLAQQDMLLNKMVDTINSLSPDIIINGGDLVNSHARELTQEAMDILARLESKEGVYSVLGNHDVGIYIRDTMKYSPADNIQELIEKQKAMGWHVLDNDVEYIWRGDQSISLTGFSYSRYPTHKSHAQGFDTEVVKRVYRDVPDSMFNIAITHAPQFHESIMRNGSADLTVAGHVHAMQNVLKIGNWRWSPALFWYDEWSGLYEKDNNKYLYINDGIGCVFFHLRFGTKPEVTLFELKKGES